MITLAIQTFERMWAQFALFGFKAWQVWFLIGLAAPTELAIVFQFVETIALDTFWSLDLAWEHWVTLSPAIFTLQDSQVNISSFNCYNILSDIKALIDKVFGLYTTLSIPDVDLDNCYIWFGRSFDHSWFRYKSGVVKNMVLLDNELNITWSEMILHVIMQEVRNTYNLEIRLRLRQLGGIYLRRINVFWIFNVIFYDKKIRGEQDFVSNNHNS